MRRVLLLSATFSLLAATASLAGGLDGLSIPAACVPGATCWIINYPDVDGEAPGRDFRCGPRTYAGHDGTDFAPADRHAMEVGVDVLAAAPGVVVSARDGQIDGAYLEQGLGAVARHECGNGVVLRHDGGWQTQYCHLRRGSVAVKPGQGVARGARLGAIGLSGKTEFPHVHMTVRHDGRAVDPFTGRTAGGGCGTADTAPLWRPEAAPAYLESVIYAAGLAARVPTAAEVKADTALPRERPRAGGDLVGWAAAFGFAPGMRFIVTLVGPDGKVLARRETAAEHPQAWRFVAAGRRVPEGGWPPGTYRVTAKMVRDGRVLSRKVTQTAVK